MKRAEGKIGSPWLEGGAKLQLSGPMRHCCAKQQQGSVAQSTNAAPTDAALNLFPFAALVVERR